jgi:hypothetical protein
LATRRERGTLAMPARELKDYTSEELVAELKRRALTPLRDDEVRTFWIQAAGVLQGVDIDAWLADVRRERDVAGSGEVE